MRAETLGRRELRWPWPMSAKNPRQPEIGEEEEDRLSHLPDDVLHQILSLLDTKSSVQLSLLSTRFKSLWKHAPRLNFNGDSFRSAGRFKTFLDRVLDARRDDSPILIRIESEFNTLSYLKSVGSFPDCDLELARVCLSNAGNWIGFSRLASLSLEDCYLFRAGNEFDFFAKFPCLKNLVLLDCNFIHSGEGFKISGPQLVSLQIHGTKNLGGARVEIVAPKLKSLSLVLYLDVPNFCSFSLPSLDHAYLGIKCAPCFVDEQKGMVAASFVKLFQALHNAASLRLDNHIIEATSKICDRLVHQPCPFTRLNCLKVPRSREPESIPNRLVTYFTKGSSSANPGFLQFV